jgi:predicted ribosomally synthesized peptide with SipW-like signal peptide
MKMRRLSKRTLVALVAVIMTLTATMGMTLAYFSDTDSAEGGAILLLSGQTEIEEHADDGSKTISITNISEDPVDMVARVRVIAPVDVEWTAGRGWTEGEDGWWYYTEAIAQGDSSTDLKVEWKIPENSEIENFDVIVVHESSPAAYTESGAIAQPDGWNCPAFE